jgi:hypothetical protein
MFRTKELITGDGSQVLEPSPHHDNRSSAAALPEAGSCPALVKGSRA